MKDNKRKLYDALSQDYDMGTFEQFSIDIDNEEKRRKLYDATSKDYDFGDFDSFSKQLGYEKQAPAVKPAKPVVGKPVEAEMPQDKEAPVQVEPDNSFPIFDDNPNPPINPEQETVRGFGAGFKQGIKQMGSGLKALGGEIANLFTGTTRDERDTLEEIERREALGIDVNNPDQDFSAAFKQYQETLAANPTLSRKEKRKLRRTFLNDMSDKMETQFLADVEQLGWAGAQSKLQKEKNLQTRISDILDETNGDVAAAKKILKKEINDPTAGDKLIDTAIAELGDMKPTEGFGAWVGDLIPQMIPSAAAMAVGVITKNPTLGKVIGGAGMGVMVGTTAGASMAEAREYGASDAQTWGVGLADAFTEYITEKIPFDRYTKRVFTGTKSKMAKEIGDALSNSKEAKTELNDLLSKANKQLGGKLFSKDNIVDYATDMLAEGVSEFAAEAIQTITPMIYANPEDYPTLGEIVANGWEGMKAGLFMGSVLGGASKSIEHAQHRSRRKQQGHVDVASVNFGGEDSDGSEIEVVEILGQNDKGEILALRDNEIVTVQPDNILEQHSFTYEEFESGRIQNELDEAFDNGYGLEESQELNDAKNMYDYQRSKLLETGDFGESFLDDPADAIKMEALYRQNTGNQETADMLLDYLNARATYEGMIQHVRDDIAGRIEASDKEIDSHTHSDGYIHPATMTTDRKVYIVNGAVAMHDDGKAVDRSKSDESVIVRDAETGKLEFVSPHDILAVDEAIDPVQEKGVMRQQISQTFAQEAADKIDGVLSFMPGDTYTGTDENGGTHTITVVADENGIYDNGDGTVNVSMDGTEPVAFPKELISAWSQQYGLNRAAEFDKQRQERRRSEQQTEQVQRVYQFNDLITIKDENGNPVRGQISAPYNEEDGKYEIYTESPVNGFKSHYLTQEELDAVVIEHNGEPIEPVTPVEPADDNTDNGTNSEEETQSALSRIPVNEQGQQVFESAPAGDTWAAFIEMSEGDKEAAMEIANGMLTNAQEAFAKAEKASKKAAKGATPFEISQAIKARKAALETARKNVSYWQSVVGYEEAQAKQAEEEKRLERRLRMAEARRIQQQKGRYSEEDKQLGDHIDFRDYVMRTLARGGVRLKWSDSPDGVIKGLASHLGFKGNQSEQAQRIWLLSNEEGLYPEAAAEALLQGYADTFGMTDGYAEDIAGISGIDAFNEMLDVILTHGNSHRGMFDAAAARHAEATQDMDDYAEGLMQHNLEIEAEANGMTVEEWQTYLEVFEAQMQEAFDAMSDEEFNSIFVELYTQQDYDTSRTGAGVREPVHEGQGPENGYSGSPQMVFGEETDLSGRVVESTEEQTEPPVFEQSGFSHVPAAETSGEFEVVGDLPTDEEFAAMEAAKTAAQVEEARAQVDPDPTEAQKEAGNYRKGHVKIDGLDITIENPKGGIRKGTDKNGKKWQTEMANDYGYIRGSQSVDGDHIDIFLSDNPTEGKVYVVDQINPDTQEFDEHKVMYGFNSAEEAEAAYLANYTKGWKGLGNITEVSKEDFKKWLDSSHRKTKPFSEYKKFSKPAEDSADEFEFNEHGVCTNPEVISLPSAKKGWAQFNEVFIAKHNGKWGASANMATSTSGAGSAVSKDACKYDTKEEAIAAAYGHLVKFRESHKSDSGLKDLDNLIKHLEKTYPALKTAETETAVNEEEQGISLSQINKVLRPVTEEIVKGITLQRRGELYDELMRTLPDEMVEAIKNVRGSIDIDATYAAKKEYERRSKEKDFVPENDNSVPKEPVSVPKSDNSVPKEQAFSIEPAQYTTKKGKVLDMHLIRFSDNLTKEQYRAAKEFAKAEKGWYDKAQDGFMMRSEESAQKLAETILKNGEDVTEAQPVSLTEISEVSDGSISVTETAPVEQGPKFRYSIRVRPSGYTVIEREDVSGKIPVEDGNFRIEAENPLEMREILANNGMQSILDELGQQFDYHIDKWQFRQTADTEGFNGYKIGEEVMYQGAKVKIHDFEEYGDHRPVLDTGLAPVMYVVGNWEDISKIDAKPVKPQQIDVEGLIGALNQHGEARLSDHAMPDYSELIFSSFGKPLTAKDGKHSLRIKNIDGAKRTVIADVNTASVGGDNLTMSFDEIADILNGDNWEEAKPNPSGNKLVTDERYAELRERMRKKLGGQMNMGIDPEILAIGTEMAVYHIEKGARKFIDFAKGMIEDLGDMIRPYLKAFYNGARELPEVSESGLADEMTPYDEVRTFDLSNFGKSAPDAFATAEHVIKEQEVAKQVEKATDAIKKTRQKPKKSKSVASPISDMGDLFSGLDEDVSPNDIDNGQRKNENRKVGEGTQHEDVRPAGEPVARHDNGNPSSDKTGGDGTPAKHESAKQVKKPVVKKNTRNNHVERGATFAPTANGERIKANIAAIRLMKQLTESGKEASKEDMAVLRQFTGWGGLGGFFNNTYSPLYEELASLVTPEELHEAAFSVNSAYYTPVEIIDTLWDIAKNLGFKGGRILEGSAGIGNILGSMPKAMNEASDITAVEIDSLTGNILKLLYPDADVRIEGFQDSDIDNNSIDLAITNVPFVADLTVYDKTEKDLTNRFGGSVQDFCIAKNVRKLKEGGIGIFISAKGSLDSAKSRKLRRWIINEGNSDVIGAFRLNNETFIGAPVTTDIIVIRKRVNGVKSPNAIDVLDTAVERNVTINFGEEYDRKAGAWVKREETYPLDYNKYFIEHPEAMGGVMMYNGERENETYRATSSALWPKDGIDQAKALAKWAKSLRNDGEAAKANTEAVELEKTDGIKEGQIIVNSKGEICVSRRGKAVPLGVNSTKVKGHSKEQVIKDYDRLKKAIDAVLDYQLKNESDSGLKPLLDELNKAYDDFTGKYGNLNKNVAISFLRNDVDYPAVAAIEKYTESETIDGKKSISVSKTDIFSRRMIGFKTEPTPKDIKDGVIVSMNQFGRIDVGYIAEKLGRTEDEVRNSILNDRLGFEDPMTGIIEVRYAYLSGNVREKLAYAKSVNKEGKYDKNIEELEKAVPMDIPAHLIEFTIGSTWIDPELYSQFAQETYGVSAVFAPVNIGGLWGLTIGDNSGYRYNQSNEKNRAAGVTSKVVHKIAFGDELMLAAMNNKTINFSKTERDYDGSTRTITDKEASQAATQRIAEIRDEFRDWCKAKMLADPELSERMKRIYNDKFNAIVPMTIDDFFLPERFEGTNTAINLYDHQKRAVIRGTMEPLMLAHEVGSGKTFTLISTAMEMRRLGTAKKPMIVVQNATVGQFVSEAKKLYPNAKVLTVSEQDRTREGRTAFYAKIKYNDWDLIIVPQSVFEMIPDSEQRQKEFIQDKIDEKMHIIQMAEAAKLDSNTIRNLKQELEDLQYEFKTGEKPAKKKKKGAKDIAKAEESAAAKAHRQLDRRTDDVSDFDDMGIDALLVDEAHSYKHLGFTTAIERGVKGVDPSYSKKSASVYLKTRAVFDKVGWKNVVFATGTPISNTAAEIWTFMKYLMPREVMEANEIYYFDDFVRNFGSIAQSLEFTTSGKFRENTRFASYVNLPELIRIWASITDTVLTKDISYVNDKVPAIEGDKAQDIFLPQSDSLVDIMRAVRSELERFEKMSGKEKKENSHIPITMYGIAKRATIDTRLVDANAPDEPLSKTNRAVEEIIKDLKETEAYNGTCAVFCDNSNRWDGEGKRVLGFNLFQEIKRKLVERGVPESQIIVIESGMTVAQKEKIFAKANAGEIRVIMGSTSTLGTGVNIQERLHMLIHMDAPDRPMDYTQRNGRILRQGNLHKPWGKPVKILRFGVEDSLDVTSYQRLKTKAGFIDSVMDGKPLIANGMENRVLEESEEGLFDNPVAVLSGSEYALLKSAAERELRKYLNKKQQYELDQIYIENALRTNAERIKTDHGLIADFTKRLKTIRALFPDGKPKHITIEGQKAKWDATEQVESIIKEYVNKPLNAYVERGRKNSYYKGENIPIRISVDDMSILATVEITRTSEWDTKLGGNRISMHKKISYSCHEIGIEDRPVPGGDVKAIIEDLRTNILTGKYAEDRIASLTAAIERMESDNALMQERRGKPFADAERLKEAQAKVDDYTEKMKVEMAEKEAKYASRGTGEATTVTLSEIADDESEEDENRYRDDEEIDDIASDYYELIDDLFNGTEGVTEKYSRKYFDVAATPDFYKAIGIIGDKFTVKYGTISSHFKKDTDHTMTKEAWDNLPQALAHPMFVTQYGERSNKYRIYTSIKIGNRYVIVGVDVIKSNQGKDKPMIEINSIRTVFAAKRIGDNETLVCYNNAITPEQEALLDGRNFRQYPTIQELSGDKVSDNSDKNNTAIDDGENVYRIREDEPPVNTGIGYKVFFLKDGKLYPPMVANPDGADTPTGVWLDADAAPVSGQSKTGRPQVKAGGRGTQGGGGQLSYRPGWHLGEIPYALQFNRLDSETGERELFPKDFVWAEVEYANDVDYQQEAMSYGYTENGNFRHSYAGLPRVPENGAYTYRTNPNPETDPWIITGAMKVNRLLTPTEVDEMVREAGREPQKRQEGAITDEQIIKLNEEISRRNHASPENMKQAAESLAESLGVKVHIVTDTNELTSDNARKQKRMRNSKGWMNTTTGEIVIVLPNNHSVADIEATILHEIVGHKGLREVVGKDNFNAFLDKVFHHASKETRTKIVELSKSRNWDFRLATEEYIARLAEEGFGNREGRNLWNIIRDFFADMISRAKIALGFHINDNDLRYMLWRSFQMQQSKGAMGVAEDVVMKQKLGVGDFRYRSGGPAPTSSGLARSIYEDAVRVTDNDGKKSRKANLIHRLKESYQDSMLALKKLQEAILAETGNDISANENAYIAENRMSSQNKGQAEIYMRDFYKPLQEAVSELVKQGAAYNDIIKYLIAKHGLERNLVFSKRDAEADGGTWDGSVGRDYSGLTDLTGSKDNYTDLAEDMVKSFEGSYDTANLWAKINAATKETLRKSYESGLMTKATYEKVRDMFKNYIPLRGWDVDVAANEYEYLSSNRPMLSPALKAAEGRKSVADDPIATIGYMAESSIIQGNRNVMKQKLLNFVLNNPTSLATVSEQWYVLDPATGNWEARNPVIPEDATADEVSDIVSQFEADMENLKTVKQATKVRDGLRLGKHATTYEGQEHCIRVKRGGKEFCIYINGNPRAAQAVNGLTNPDSSDSSIYKAAKAVKNFMARMFTSQNPAFVVTNLCRDVIWAGTAVAVKEDKAYAAQYSKNIAGAFKLPALLRKFQNGTLDMSYDVERYFEEFIKNGGETGFTELNTVEDYKRDIERFLKEADRNGVTNLPKKAWRGLWGCIEFMNRCAEDTTRFMVYMTSRQMGRSVADSVYDAKEITVNFNKKGSGGFGASVMNFAYIFFNATVQGLANFGKMLYHHPGKTAAALSVFTAAGMLTPMLAVAMQAMFGDDDDDSYWDLPEWVRRNNLVFFVPWSDNGYLTIPLPHELRPFFGMGELAFSCLAGKEDAEDALGKAVQGFSGLLPLDYTGNAGNVAVNFTPTIAQPFAQLVVNKDYFGKPIYKKNDYNELDPEWTKAYKGTNAWLVNATKWLNDVTGGDNVKSGVIDLNPAQIEHLFESYLGGVGKTLNKGAKTFSMLWNEDMREWRNVPVVSSFYQEAEERTTGSQMNREYFDYKEEHDEIEHRISGYKKQIRMGAMEYAEILNDFMQTPEFKRYVELKGYVNAVSKMNSSLKYADKTQREEIEQRITEIKQQLVNELHEEE